MSSNATSASTQKPSTNKRRKLPEATDSSLVDASAPSTGSSSSAPPSSASSSSRRRSRKSSSAAVDPPSSVMSEADDNSEISESAMSPEDDSGSSGLQLLFPDETFTPSHPSLSWVPSSPDTLETFVPPQGYKRRSFASQVRRFVGVPHSPATFPASRMASASSSVKNLESHLFKIQQMNLQLFSPLLLLADSVAQQGDPDSVSMANAAVLLALDLISEVHQMRRLNAGASFGSEGKTAVSNPRKRSQPLLSEAEQRECEKASKRLRSRPLGSSYSAPPRSSSRFFRKGFRRPPRRNLNRSFSTPRETSVSTLPTSNTAPLSAKLK